MLNRELENGKGDGSGIYAETVPDTGVLCN